MMKRMVWHWIISALALWLSVLALTPHVSITNPWNILWLAPLIGLVNALVGIVVAVIKIIALPVNLLTLGCFGFVLSFVMNGLAVYFLSTSMNGIMRIDSPPWGWGTALVFLMAVFGMLLNMVLPGKRA